MNQNELIADKIEEIIAGMFSAVRTGHSGQFSYSLLLDPGKHQTWFVALFSETVDKLKSALKDGTCYLLYSYLQDKFSKDQLLSTLDIFISFEIGNRPANTEAYEKLHVTLSNKSDKLRNSTDLSDETNCMDCGHNFNEHQLMTFGNEAPLEGWIICPVNTCTCFKTWGANYSDENTSKTINIQ